MIATIIGLGAELPREEDRRPARNVAFFFQSAELRLELLDLNQLRTARSDVLASIDLCLEIPAAHALCMHSIVFGCRLGLNDHIRFLCGVIQELMNASRLDARIYLLRHYKHPSN